MEQDQIIRFITGNLEESEALEIRNWIKADAANKHEFIRLKNIYAFASEGKRKLKVEDDFLLINQQIRQNSGKSKYRILKIYLKYAAIVIFALLIGFNASNLRYLLSSDQTTDQCNEFYTPEGQISEFRLVDGTRVWTNSGTHVKVPVNFNSKYRIIYVDGEAFFEVKKSSRHPFFIHTNNISVRVMGTSFNVSAYQSEANTEVTLIEGKVGIKERDGQRLALLNPGQQLVYEKATGKKIKKEVDTAPYEAWRDGKMIFKNQSLEYIAKRLERWYNVEISFKDEVLSQIKFSGTILKNKPLSQVLEIISLSSPEMSFDIKLNSGEKSQVVLYSSKIKSAMKK